MIISTVTNKSGVEFKVGQYVTVAPDGYYHSIIFRIIRFEDIGFGAGTMAEVRALVTPTVKNLPADGYYFSVDNLMALSDDEIIMGILKT
jgi:hypothetical protein